MVVAEAVGMQAIADRVSPIADEATLKDQLQAYVWEPVYVPYERLL